MKKMLMLPLMIATLAACAANVETQDVDAVLELEGDPVAGETVYGEHCTRCHGEDGSEVGAALLAEVVPATSDEDLVESILRDPAYMPNFINTLESQEVADVLAHLTTEYAE